MTFFNPQQDFVRPNMGEEYYYGTVIDNNDPAKLHRIKIRIPELHGTDQDIPDDNLPWAIHFRPTFLGGGTDLSLAAIPRIGSDVVVIHMKGDVYQPAYVFELAHNNNRLSQAEQNYPNSYVLRDSDSNFWHVDLVNDKLDIKFNGSEALNITVDRDTIIGNNETNDIGNDQTNTIGNNQTSTILGSQSSDITGTRTETIGSSLTQTVGTTKTVNAVTLVINTSANVDINAGANVTIDGSLIVLNGGSGGGVVTSTSINHATGIPHGDSSSTVTCDY